MSEADQAHQTSAWWRPRSSNLDRPFWQSPSCGADPDAPSRIQNRSRTGAKALVALLACSILASVTDAQAVNVLSTQISMNSQIYVNAVHDITVTMVRDQSQQPQILWQENSCFELIFTMPYKKSSLYEPFDRSNAPACSLITPSIFVDGINCEIGDETNTLKFSFAEFKRPDLTQMVFSISNFQNPWSAATMDSIRIDSYQSNDCSGSADSSVSINQQSFYAARVSEDLYSVTSSTDELGNSSAGNEVTFGITPKEFFSKTGSGQITIEIPSWYDLDSINSRNMMFSTENEDFCRSTNMRILSSTAEERSSTITITYDQMPVDKVAEKILITCKGFFNPIYQDKWYGFLFTTYDNEKRPNQIERSESVAIDASRFKPAQIDSSALYIQPRIITIGEYSVWTLSLTKFPIPLEAGCYARIIIPRDLSFVKTSVSGYDIFSDFTSSVVQDMVIDENIDPRGISVTFPSCLEEAFLGPSPQGRLEINRIKTPNARRDTGLFFFELYKDESYTSPIAVLTDGVKLSAGDLETGVVSIGSVLPAEYGVQVVTDYTFIFTTQHSLDIGASIRIEFPTSIILPATGSTVQVRPEGAIKDIFVATYGTVESGNAIVIYEVFGNVVPAEGGIDFQFVISGIQNPSSSRPAGNVSIYTLIDGFQVDYGTSDGTFTPTSGAITGKEIVISDAVTSGIDSSYTLIFVTASSIPKNGLIVVEVPAELTLRPIEVLSGGSCLVTTFNCLSVVNNFITIQTTEAILSGTDITIIVYGVNNPRSNIPTSVFVISTFDSDGVSEIDSGFRFITSMEVYAGVSDFSVQPSNDVNGEVNTFTFTISSRVTIIDGDVLSFIVPEDIGIPFTPEELEITPIPRIVDEELVQDEMRVQINGRQIIIYFVKVAPTTEIYKWTLSGMRNPPSMRTSGSFINLILKDAQGYFVQQFYGVGPTITNLQPALILSYSLVQQDDEPSTPTTYEIIFMPTNPIPPTGSIQIKWPDQIQVPDTVACIVNTNKQYSGSVCEISQVNQSITITNVFLTEVGVTTNFFSQVTITLVGVVNPLTNQQRGSGFLITTYADAFQIYRIDYLPQEYLIPTLDCNYPCRTCLTTDKDWCESCWTPAWSDKQYFQRDEVTDRGFCDVSCPEGYTRDNSDSYVCIKCDITCGSCKDEDKEDCTVCSLAFPYRLSGTGYCLESCSRGYYETATSLICGRCEFPCADCEGDSKYCTACDEDSDFPFLFERQCYKQCALGFTDVNGVCVKCDSPCATCVGTPNQCLSCDGTEEVIGSDNFRRFLYANQCYAECPPNTAPVTDDEDNLTCIGCEDPACYLCSDQDPAYCLRCKQPFKVHEGVCVAGCPEDWKENADNSACVLYTINDLGIIPFPFLIAAFFGCLIAFFGKCKKKPGRTKQISLQNTITCFIVILAFIQFLALGALVAWALLFGTMDLFIGAIILLVLLILLNMIFQIFYTCTFNSRVTPKDKLRKYKDGTISSKAELRKYIVPSDEKFYTYTRKHGCVSCTIAILTFMCTFKCNKMYYSRFYSFDMFKARWSLGKYYRKSMTIFCIVSMIIDGFIITLCIASLLNMVVMSNMLWVTTVEVAVLSLLLIILGCVELYLMKQYLLYNEGPKKQAPWDASNTREKMFVSSTNDFLDKDSREHMMKNLLKNVRTNQDMFLNNKLDDLLNMFGDRRCKSMIELGTGWDKEDDPRMCITWPLSPSKRDEYDGDYKFTKDDMIGGFEDNVYAEVKVKDPVYEVAVQGDQGQQDFMRQLHRKQGDLLAGTIDEDDELKNRKTKGKRRGRKNKYYTAIDAEDDEEADGQEPSVVEDEDEEEETNLAIIKEQEEEEEQLRQKVEEERKKQEAAQAARRAKLAEAERLRLEAEAAEEEARRQADLEEENAGIQQEEEELSRMRELEATRLRLAKEEQEAKEKATKEELARQKKLAEMSEANRVKYEAEESARQKAHEEEQARMKREAEELEAKIQAELSEKNALKLKETQKLQAQRDEEELRLRKEMLDREERQRQEEKEAERLRLEQESNERRIMASKTAEEKRVLKLESERLQKESNEMDRQKKLAQAELERQEAIRLEDEMRKKRQQEEDMRRIQLEEEDRLRKEKLSKDEATRLAQLAKDEEERKARFDRMENARVKQTAEEEKIRMETLRIEEEQRLEAIRIEEEQRLESIRIEEEQRLESIRIEEERRLEILRIEEERRIEILRIEEETRLRKIEEEFEARAANDEAERKAKLAEEERRAREEEARILREQQQIEEEKAHLTVLKKQQEAELADIARREQERKDRELRDEEERIERERLEREAMDREKAELARKQKEAELRLQSEKDELMRAKLLKEAEELEKQEQLRKERAAFEEEKRRRDAEEEAKRQEEERRRLEEEARRVENGTQMSGDIIPEKNVEEEDEALEAEIVMSQELIQDFNKPAHPVEMPPNADNRTFNVNDILGELDRDERGNIIVLQDSQGNNRDKTGHPTNIRGYLTDPKTGDVLENYTRTKLFDATDIDDKGEVPAPFCVEKFNFNPHDLMGDLEFQYDQVTGRAIPQLLKTKQNFYVDKKGRRVNRFGWLVQGGNGHIVDKLGRKKFDRKQLDDEDLQKLLNYGGKRYDIKDLMGVFDKDANGNIILQQGPAGSLVDNVGRRVNDKGYLIDTDGNIVDREGKVIWVKEHLKNGEFPKIFLFTKFNIDNILGDFEMSPLSEPILEQDKNGNFIDRKGRLVNSRGYLIDKAGNVIDKRGRRMFDKIVLTSEGEIPKIFRMQILKTDSGSSLSRLMDEIEKNQPSEYERVDEENEEGGDGDTSVDSAMEDTPANYNIPNQRFDEYEDYQAIPEESDRQVSHKPKRRPQPAAQAQMQPQIELPRKKTKKKSKKKKKTGYLEYLMPTNREVSMAGAYGGQAKGQFRRDGVKYDKERLMNRIKTPANIPGGRAQLEALAATVAGFHKPQQSQMEDDKMSARGAASRPPRVKRNQFMDGSNDGGSQFGGGNSQLDIKKLKSSKNRDSRSNLNELRDRKLRTQQRKGDANDGDFEKMFGKDIDQYLEGSEFDLDEYDRLSQFSKGTGRNSQANIKLKAMEQVYLQRIESSQVQHEKKSQLRPMVKAATTQSVSKKTKSPKKPPAFREFQDRFVDQPDFIHRGEILEFETSKQSGSTKKKAYGASPLRDGPGGPSNFGRQSRQRQ